MYQSMDPYVQADGVVNAAAAAPAPAPPARRAAPPPPPAAPKQGGTKVSPLVVKLEEAIQFCGAASGVPLQGPLASAGDASVVRAAVAGGPGTRLTKGCALCRCSQAQQQAGAWTGVPGAWRCLLWADALTPLPILCLRAGDASATEVHLWWRAESGTLVLVFKASHELDRMVRSVSQRGLGGTPCCTCHRG